MMQKQLEFIQSWLEQHAPKIATQSLNPAANNTELEAFEVKISKQLPEDFKALYHWHDGMNEEENLGSLFYGMEFLSLANIENRRMQLSDLVAELFVLEHADPEINPSNAYHRDWIQFAHDGGRTGLYLDLAPTASGIHGQIIFIDYDYNVGILVANSLSDLLAQFCNDLQSDLYQLNEDALEDENEFLDSDPSIDLVNWHMSERWARPDFE
jgi:cell wall assembly regulator SMI1